MTRIDTKQEVQRLDINSPWVPAAFRLMLKHPSVMNARTTRNVVVEPSEEMVKAMEAVQENTHRNKEANHRANTVRLKCINKFTKATDEGYPIYLDKDGNFNTAMHSERRIPLRMSHAEPYMTCTDIHSNYWPRLIIKENNGSNHHHILEYGDLRAEDKFTIHTIEGLTEQEFVCVNGEYFPPGTNTRQVIRDTGDRRLAMPHNIHGMEKDPHKYWKKRYSHASINRYNHAVCLRFQERETNLRLRIMRARQQDQTMAKANSHHQKGRTATDFGWSTPFLNRFPPDIYKRSSEERERITEGERADYKHCQEEVMHHHMVNTSRERVAARTAIAEAVTGFRSTHLHPASRVSTTRNFSNYEGKATDLMCARE